ncbi:hypothetical protein EBA05_08530 [Xanthomonas oryzae pv. oryzae]|uniref:hypothetical protein n=1 Tax=Xanthomonas oryzae TaxID=347 RepID=UPI000B4202E9|nr:hypothetical protein [Xanthomonas oryzae]AVU02484.1 hypothetical protein C0L90_08490 [Xanthomonas oryzae pv. oryzae]OWB26843.1 hypothetical protein XocBAI21_17435 [Xanthomonas oryzae pv. oryzicola]QBI15683.1 hypothetical protein EYR03_08555 [Xanthomonas oryzae pv. oryzae]QBN38974.1 hypothetical protein EBA04_08535 [Xanthomonas oryzae pv. oryzae]QBN42649.1 hypothetical protein EBA05_08530 [Xanthomonas oryzae pv. oryzae]
MNNSAYLLALSDALQLHDERVDHAIERCRKLHDELRQAEQHRILVMQCRADFKAAIKELEGQG